jgi:hypothetical protein
MNFLHTIENSALIEWFLTSMWGFPVFIALHSVGMAFVVGLSLILALRYLGFVADISPSIVEQLIKAAWLGFALNVVTGVFLLLSRVTEYLFDPTFLVKITCVALAAIGLRMMQSDFRVYFRTRTQNAMALDRRYVAVLTVLFWFGAVTAGRWIAYLSGVYS